MRSSEPPVSQGLSRARQRGNSGASLGAAGARLLPNRAPHPHPAGPEPAQWRQRCSEAALGPDPRAPARGYPRAEPAPLARTATGRAARPHGGDPAGPYSATRQPRGKPDSGRSAALRPGPRSPAGGWSAISPPALLGRDTELSPPSLPAFPRAAPRGASPPAAVRGRHPPRSAPPAPSRPRSGRRHFDSKPLPRPGRGSGHGACAAALRSLGHVVRGRGGVGGGPGTELNCHGGGGGSLPCSGCGVRGKGRAAMPRGTLC